MLNLFKKIFFRKSPAFTLLEVLIAVFVLLIGVVGSVDLITTSFSQVLVNESKLTATYLAAEGLEIVRNIRDNNINNGLSWNDGLSNGNYRVDWLSNNLRSISETKDAQLLVSNTYGFNYQEGGFSRFYRIITIVDEDPNDGKIFIKSKVFFKVRGKDFQTEVSEYLFDWR